LRFRRGFAVTEGGILGATGAELSLDIVFEDGVSVNLQGDAVPLLDEEDGGEAGSRSSPMSPS